MGQVVCRRNTCVPLRSLTCSEYSHARHTFGIRRHSPLLPVANGSSRNSKRLSPTGQLTKRPRPLARVPCICAFRLKLQSLSSASGVERSVDEDFRYFEAHRDPRTQKLGKERERIAFVIGDIIGKGRSFQSITRHRAHLNRGQRMSGP